jgi:hypothetical protein
MSAEQRRRPSFPYLWPALGLDLLTLRRTLPSPARLTDSQASTNLHAGI